MNLRKATLIYAVGKYSKVILQLIVTIILARLLTPYDYGIVAIVTVFSTLFASFSDMGFGVAIVQKRWLTSQQINDIFSFTFYFAIIISIFFGLLSYLIAGFYHNKAFIKIGWLLSISLFFNAINMVPNGLMNKQQLFIKISVRTVSAYFISAILAIVLAILHFRYYALVMQSVVAAFITFVWNIHNSNFHLRLHYDLQSIKLVSSYSGYQFAFNIVNYLSENLDNLLTGKFFGSKQLGYYNKAFTLSLYPVDNLVGVITPVLHPVLAKYQNDKDTIYNKYLKVYKLLFLIGIYISFLCYIGSSEMILLFYGSQWESTIPCFHILSVVIFTRILNSSCGAIFQALNSTKLLFYNGTVNAVITVSAILIGIFAGGSIFYLSISVAIAYILQFITAFYMLIVMAFKYKILRFLKDTCSYIIIFTIMLIASLYCPLPLMSNLFLSLLMKIVYITVVFCSIVFITGQMKFLLSIARR